MTTRIDYDAVAATAYFVLPIACALIAIIGAALVTRRAVATVREMHEDTRHWRDETFAMREEVTADRTIQFGRRGVGRPVTVQDQVIGLDLRPGQRAARQRDAYGFRGELPVEEP
jgi:hypothetical protein